MRDATMAPETPPSRPARSIPVVLVSDAGKMVATFAVIFLLRWLIQHHTLNADDAWLFWYFIPFYLVVR